jgi:hypothetical protein
MMRWARLVAILSMLAGFLIITGPAATAVDCGPLKPLDPITPGGGCPPPGADTVKGIIDSVCPRRVAPDPEPPDMAGDPNNGAGGMYGTYRLAGLYWTTYDQPCISSARLDNGMAVAANDLSNQFDALVGQLQSYALDPNTTNALEGSFTSSVSQLGTTFWTPWSQYGMAAAGVALAAGLVTGKVRTVGATATSALVVLGAITFLVQSPQRIPDLSSALTIEVGNKAAQALAVANGQDPATDPKTAFTEGYHSLSYAAWLRGAFCNQPEAAAEFGPKFRAAQAYTVIEDAAIRKDPGQAKKLKEQKNKDWLAHAEELSKKYPGAFACWSGHAGSRTAAGLTHLAGSLAAGVWIALASIGVLILRNILIFGIMLAVAVGAFLLASQKITSKYFNFLAIGAIGPPVVAIVMAVLQFTFVAILADTQQAWWRSIAACLSLGASMWFARRPLAHLITGWGYMPHSQHGARRMRRHAVHAGQNAVGTGMESATGTLRRGGSLAGGAASGVANQAMGGVTRALALANMGDSLREGGTSTPKTSGTPTNKSHASGSSGDSHSPEGTTSSPNPDNDLSTRTLDYWRQRAQDQGFEPTGFPDKTSTSLGDQSNNADNSDRLDLSAGSTREFWDPDQIDPEAAAWWAAWHQEHPGGDSNRNKSRSDTQSPYDQEGWYNPPPVNDPEGDNPR